MIKVKVKVSYVTSAAKQAKTAFLHGPTDDVAISNQCVSFFISQTFGFFLNGESSFRFLRATFPKNSFKIFISL